MTGRVHEDDIRDYAFFKKLTQLPYIEAMYLVGSRATGEHVESSDVDMLILCPDASDKEWAQVQHIIRERDLLVEVDFWRFDALKPGKFKQDFNRTKCLIYMRPAQHHIRVFSQTLLHHAAEPEQFKSMLARLSDGAEDKQKALRMFFNKLDRLRATMRTGLLAEGIRTAMPLDTFRKAHKQGWVITHREWEPMVNHWICAQGICAPALTDEIYVKLPHYAELMQRSYDAMLAYEKGLDADAPLQEASHGG